MSSTFFIKKIGWKKIVYLPKCVQKNLTSSKVKRKNIVRKETDEFYKSVCTYITDEKYNQEFFIKNDPPNSDLWESELWWEIYKIIR